MALATFGNGNVSYRKIASPIQLEWSPYLNN